jgi:protein-disulfide isomerase
VPAETRGRRGSARERAAARRAAEEAARAAARRRRRTLGGGVVAAVLVVVAVVAVVLVQSQRTATSPAAPTPSGTTDGGAAFALGPDQAPVTVDVYEDFLCPYCAEFEAAAGGTLEQLAADGAVRLRHHPIAFLDRASTDDYSTRALNAAAVVADAAGTGAFLAFSDLLFAEQPAEGGPGLPDDRLVELAVQAGASGEDVERGIRELRYGDWTQRVTDAASRAGITGTPTVLVDGEPLPGGALTAQGVRDAVEAATP